MRWLCFVSVLCWSAQATASPAILREGDSVVLMGDSEAFLLAQEFPSLAERANVSFHAVPVPGSSVVYWANGGPWDKIAAFNPTVLLISLGANDACMGARVVQNERPFLIRMMRRIGRLDARAVIWLGPPKIGDRTKFPQAPAGQEMFADLITTQTPFTFLDARNITVGMWNDKLHCSRPTTASDRSDGCRTWATWAWDYVKSPR